MASAATARGVLCRLRRDIARIEGRLAEADRLAFVSEGRGDSEGQGVSGSFAAAEGGVSGNFGADAGSIKNIFSLTLRNYVSDDINQKWN